MLRPKLQAVAAATLEQIEFLSDSRREDIPVRYREPSGERFFKKLTAPFNFLYLLNGQGDMASGNRKHLVKMIARAIMAMTIEPSSQQVTSDANNKLADILGLRDPTNGHRQCFASYGLWYGTPGHQSTDVQSWICSRLEETGTGPSPNNTDYSSEVEEKLRVLPDISTKANKIGKPTKPINWQLPKHITPQTVIESVLRCLEKYLSDTVEPVVRSASEEIFPPNGPYKPFLDAANEMIERDVFEAAPLKPLGQVGVCLNQWIDQLDGWPENERPEQASDYIAAKEKIMDDARESLRELAPNTPPDTWTPDDVNPLLSEVIDRNWSDLVRACLYENLSKSIEQTSKVFRLRKQTMNSIVSLAATGYLPTSVDFSSISDKENSDEHQEDLFSIPLYTSRDPTNAPSSHLTKDFRQKFIRPILSRLVLTLDKAKPREGDIDIVKRNLEKELSNLQGNIGPFLHNVEEDNNRKFHEHLPSNSEATRHPYYEPIRDVYRLSTPKIDLDHANVYAKPLDVTVSQHVRKCCVSDLLSYNLGSTFREAHVIESYERETKVWFQLLRLCYGFCLEAISTYKNYVAATHDYVTRRGFKYSSVWLDSRWYMAYQKALEDWKHDKGDMQKRDETQKVEYDKKARLLGPYQTAVQIIINGLIKVGIPKGEKDIGTAVKTTAMCKEVESKVNSILSNLAPGDEPTTIFRGMKQAEELMKPVYAKLEDFLGQLSEQEQAKMKKCWDICRQNIDEISKIVKGQ